MRCVCIVFTNKKKKTRMKFMKKERSKNRQWLIMTHDLW